MQNLIFMIFFEAYNVKPKNKSNFWLGIKIKPFSQTKPLAY
jgi:hypothetical protein